MKLRDILNGIPVKNITGDADIDIKGIAYSSKDSDNDSLFAAFKGIKTDGNLYIKEALEKGATAVLSERQAPEDFTQTWIQVEDARETTALLAGNFYEHPSKKIKVIGITGTKGKTTTSYLLESILNNSGNKAGVIGTVSYRFGNQEKPASRTTPEALDIQNMMKNMLDSGYTHCIIEVSSHALELKRVTGINFSVAIFTNLSGDHLDYHRTMEEYFTAKKKLFQLKSERRIAVVNADSSWGQRLISELPLGIISYGTGPSAIVRAEGFEFSSTGTKITVRYPTGTLFLNSALLGRPNLFNILAAVSTALSLNIPLPAIQKGISDLKEVPGRFEKIENKAGLNIFVDYAHSDDALRNLLETAREICTKKVILVFGAGGDRDKSKRPRMGEIAGMLADWSIITSDNPRTEDPLKIISDIESGFKKSGSSAYEIEPNRKNAIFRALSMGESGDYILIAGKGHEDYQIIQDKVLPFKDADVVREWLAQGEKN
ncbi:MAG: UDP-N-acetylmuramoyl-L-alanyl-D-glutamate--2,6-diaminopimelate ligase [Candidatus Aminicenantes bacterium]|nr:UDP-N-acetylmuramoyl-L-alanyl-D-glutamate--2,6-diaminopimelate ligase [Candidatus Aminicenantes bacterium]